MSGKKIKLIRKTLKAKNINIDDDTLYIDGKQIISNRNRKIYQNTKQLYKKINKKDKNI